MTSLIDYLQHFIDVRGPELQGTFDSVIDALGTYYAAITGFVDGEADVFLLPLDDGAVNTDFDGLIHS